MYIVNFEIGRNDSMGTWIFYDEELAKSFQSALENASMSNDEAFVSLTRCDANIMNEDAAKVILAKVIKEYERL